MRLEAMRFGPQSLATRCYNIIKWSLLLMAAIFALVVDLVTKYLAEQHLVLGETEKIFSFFSLERTINTGVAFGMLKGSGAVIIVANVIAILIVLFYVLLERRPILGGVSGGLIIGGSRGNVVQRLANGEVTDFLKLPYWPNFNMADVFLVVGIAVVIIGLIVETVRTWKSGRSETPTLR